MTIRNAPEFLIASICFLAFPVVNALAQPAVEVVEVRKIWDQGEHNAFTDIIRYDDRWYCTFREGGGHVKGDGKIRIITSDDTVDWESAGLLEEEGIDLRDPKLCITPDKRLMVVMGGSVYRDGELVGRQPRVAFSPDGKTWSKPQRVCEEGDWLWRVTWYEGAAYGVSYRNRDAEGWGMILFRSEDGVDYEPVTTWDIHGGNETTLRFTDEGECIAFVRRELGSKNAFIGTSQAPYTEWNWTETDHRVGGPDFIILPDGDMWGGGRRYLEGGNRTGFGHMTRTSYEPLVTLPSGGDTSYPGFVWHEDTIWMSYYASHEGKTSIYLAEINIENPK